MTVNRDAVLEALSAELDGELSPEELLKLEQALGGDAELRQQAEAWSDIGRRIGDVSDIPIPPAAEMLARIQEDIRSETTTLERGRRILFPPVWAAAAAVLLLLLGAFLWVPRSGDAVLNWQGLAGVDDVEPGLWVETHIPDSTAVVYEDEQTGVTVIWMVTDHEEMQDG